MIVFIFSGSSNQHIIVPIVFQMEHTVCRLVFLAIAGAMAVAHAAQPGRQRNCDSCGCLFSNASQGFLKAKCRLRKWSELAISVLEPHNVSIL